MDTKTDVFKDGYLEIHDNVLKFKNNIIQLSNISRVCIAPMEKQPIPQTLWFALLLGFACCVINVMIGVLIMGGSLFCIAKIVSENNALGYYLKLELNSGRNIYFNANSKDFLNRIVNVIENCFNVSHQNITIDMKNGSINMKNDHVRNMQVGDQNIMENTR